MFRASQIIRNSPAHIKIILIAVASMLLVNFSGLIGTKIFAPRFGWSSGSEIATAAGKQDTVEGRFFRYDSGYYLTIALHGYKSDGPERAFFPLYPGVVSLFSRLTSLDLFWSGYFLSAVFAFISLWFLYKLVKLDYSQNISLWVVAWAAFFPMAFFNFSFYAESLFVMLCVVALFFVRRGNFVTAGVIIAFAGATRPQAILLAIPYVAEYLQQRDWKIKRLIRFCIGALIAPVGMVGFLLYLSSITNQTNLGFGYAESYGEIWKTWMTWPWVTLFDGISAAVAGSGINPDWFSRVLVWQDLVYTILGIIASVWCLRHSRLSTALLVTAGMIFFLMFHGPYGYALWSMPRHVLSLFPLYLMLGVICAQMPGRPKWAILSLSVLMLCASAMWFASGRWVA